MLARSWLAVWLLTLALPGGVLAQAPPPAPLKPYVVVIAPGHGGDDPGAVFPLRSLTPALREKDFTLPIALKLRDALAEDEVRVVLTRIEDVSSTAEERAALAARAGADLFVAVHVNSFFADPTVGGAEVQFFSDPRPAASVAEGLASALLPFQQMVRETKDREEDNILAMPGVIVEVAYLSNERDRRLLQQEDYQQAVARGVRDGVVKYAPQIDDLKPQLREARAATASRPAALPALAPATPPARGRGWAARLGVGLAGALGLLALLARYRRWLRSRRRPRVYATRASRGPRRPSAVRK